MANKFSFENGRISVMDGSRQVILKVMLFQLRGRGYPQNDAMPNFFPNSKSPILVVSNYISFIFRIHLESTVKSFALNDSVALKFLQNALKF